MSYDQYSMTMDAISELGLSNESRLLDNGQRISDQEIAGLAIDSFLDHRDELPQLPMGSSKKEYQRALKDRKIAAKRLVTRDIAQHYGLDEKEMLGVLAAIALFFFGGPVAFIVAVIAAVVEWAISAELDKRYGMI